MSNIILWFFSKLHKLLLLVFLLSKLHHEANQGGRSHDSKTNSERQISVSKYNLGHILETKLKYFDVMTIGKQENLEVSKRHRSSGSIMMCGVIAL